MNNMLYRTDDIQNNPFNGRRVAYTGTFTIDSRSLSKKLKEWGADVNNAITKSTNIVLIGENPNADKINQLEARIHDGFHIKKLYQEDLSTSKRRKNFLKMQEESSRNPLRRRSEANIPTECR